MNSSKSILIIEDNSDIAALTGDFLAHKGYSVDFAADGLTGLHLAVSHHFDVIVIDISLPGMDGYQICRYLRQNAKIDTPVIMLTARDTLDDKLQGFRAGADDYVVKPFDMLELEARIMAQVRRKNAELVKELLKVGDLEFDQSTLTVTRAGRTITLTPRTLKILEVLMRASPGVVSRQELERQIWGDERPDSDALRSHLYLLRKKIDKPFSRPLLKNLPGNGYQLIAQAS